MTYFFFILNITARDLIIQYHEHLNNMDNFGNPFSVLDKKRGFTIFRQ